MGFVNQAGEDRRNIILHGVSLYPRSTCLVLDTCHHLNLTTAGW